MVHLRTIFLFTSCCKQTSEPSSELMSANLEAMILGKQGTLQTLLSITLYESPKGGKNRYEFFSLVKKFV